MKLNVSLRVSAFSTNVGEDGVRLCVRDDTSRIEILTVDLPFAEWAKAGTGRSGEGVAEFRPANAGKVHEHKTEEVLFDLHEWNRKDQQALTDALEPYETDGWRGSRQDLTNHHNRRGPGLQAVSFHRYVDPPQGGE